MPVDAHRIRLHGPWTMTPLSLTVWTNGCRSRDVPGEVPAARTVTIPSDWRAALGTDFSGRVLYQRRFGRPAQLDPHERVDLVIERIVAFGEVTLNEEGLGVIECGSFPWRCDITSRLQPRNLLTIEVDCPRGIADSGLMTTSIEQPLRGGLVGEVRLEIYTVAEPLDRLLQADPARGETP